MRTHLLVLYLNLSGLPAWLILASSVPFLALTLWSPKVGWIVLGCVTAFAFASGFLTGGIGWLFFIFPLLIALVSVIVGTLLRKLYRRRSSEAS